MSLASPRTVADQKQQQNNQDFYREILNIQGQQIDISDTGVGANTEFAVVHGLGRVPSNVQLLVKQGQTDAYLSIRPGSTAWTNTRIYLDCSSANAALRILVT